MGRTEYAIEVYNENGSFNRQLDVFNTYEEAENFKDSCNEKLGIGESLGILAINYDEFGYETGVEPL